MNPNLRTLRASAPFSPWWHLVPWAVAGTALIAAWAEPRLGGDDTLAPAVVETAPAQPAAAGAAGT